MQPSASPEILFLKLPATMLQTSPSASDTSGPTLLSSTPSILEVMSAAAFPSHRTLSTPDNCPANPTMAVNSGFTASALVGTVSGQPSINSKTSRVAVSSNGIQVSWPPSTARCSPTDFMTYLRGQGRHVPSPAPA